MGNTASTEGLQQATDEAQQEVEEQRGVCQRWCLGMHSETLACRIMAHAVLCATVHASRHITSMRFAVHQQRVHLLTCLRLMYSCSQTCQAYLSFHAQQLTRTVPPVQAPAGIKLFQFVKAASGGKWELVSSRAQPRFYDANEDQRNKQPDYYLEIESGDIDQRADGALSYVADPAARRVTFAANDSLWALKFPAADSYRAFMTELEVREVSCRSKRVHAEPPHCMLLQAYLV